MVPENYKQCARQKHIETHMFNIPMAQAYTDIQSSNISPWHIPNILTERPNPMAPQGQDKHIFFCQWSGSPMSHRGTGAAHLSTTRHNLDRPAVLSTPLAPEPAQQLRVVAGIATKPQHCWREGTAGVFRPSASRRLEQCQH